MAADVKDSDTEPKSNTASSDLEPGDHRLGAERSLIRASSSVPENGRRHTRIFESKKAILRDATLPLSYLAVLIIAYIRYGLVLQFTLGAVALMVLPVAAYAGKSSEFLRNSFFFVIVLLSYEALQGMTGIIVNVGNVISLAAIDRALFGYNFTAAVQTAFASPTVTLFATFFYGLHIYLVVIAVILFWFTNKRVYRGYTYSMIMTSYLALVTFALLPSAPPWFTGTAKNLVSQGFNMLPGALQTIQQALLSIESDKLAAFPSLHAAYATLFSVYTIRLKPVLGLISVPILIGILFSTIYLGQHYVIDLVAGIGYSLAAVLVVEKLLLSKRRDNPSRSSASAR